jgi:hypothetical protein
MNPTQFSAVQLASPSNIVLASSTATPVHDSFAALAKAGVDHSTYVLFEAPTGVLFSGQLADWFTAPDWMCF